MQNAESKSLPALKPGSLLTGADLAARFDISPGTLAYWIRSGRIRPVRIQVKNGVFVGSDFRYRHEDVLNALAADQFPADPRLRDPAMG